MFFKKKRDYGHNDYLEIKPPRPKVPKKEFDPSIRVCPKCKGELVYDGSRISANIRYQVWKCSKCGKEDIKFNELYKD